MKFKVMVGVIIDADMEALQELGDVQEAINSGKIYVENAVMRMKSMDGEILIDNKNITEEVSKVFKKGHEV